MAKPGIALVFASGQREESSVGNLTAPCRLFPQPSTMSGGSRVYVGRLSYQTREKDIERFFRGYGRLTEVNLKNGFGFVVSGLIHLMLLLFMSSHGHRLL